MSPRWVTSWISNVNYSGRFCQLSWPVLKWCLLSHLSSPVLGNGAGMGYPKEPVGRLEVAHTRRARRLGLFLRHRYLFSVALTL